METDIALKITAFFNQFKHQIYKKGEILIRADEAPLGIFYLKSGLVKQYFLTKNGDEFVVNIFKTGAYFPMSWAMNNTPNNFYFEVVEISEIFKVPKENILEFLKNNPDVLFDLLRRVYLGTDGLLIRMAYLMSGNAHEQLIIELLIHARRFGQKKNDTVIQFTASEKDLATHAGLTRETVSRELKKLKEKNLAVFDKGTVIIPDLKNLEEELF